jgi:N6-adenosine-specific RNA methylase IME4
MTAPAETPDIDALARAIGAAWRRGVEAILETGRLMFEAREALGDDDWTALLVNLPFGPRYAQMLVRIGADKRLPKHVSLLPTDTLIIYNITQLSDQKFDELKAADAIHPGMSRNDLDTLVKQEARAAKERALAERTIAANSALNAGLAGGGVQGAQTKYNVLYADPPWRLEPYSRERGLNKAAENHYPTMSAPEIAALPMIDLAANDAVLFLWATVPLLVEACMTLAAWGFAYKSHFVWIKDKSGTGYWNRNRHELLLVGTRGAIPAPAPGTQVSSVFQTGVRDRLRHSEKPLEARAMIEAYYPSCPKIELFARPPAPQGWDLWGNEAPRAGCGPGWPAAGRNESLIAGPEPAP